MPQSYCGSCSQLTGSAALTQRRQPLGGVFPIAESLGMLRMNLSRRLLERWHNPPIFASLGERIATSSRNFPKPDRLFTSLGEGYNREAAPGRIAYRAQLFAASSASSATVRRPNTNSYHPHTGQA